MLWLHLLVVQMTYLFGSWHNEISIILDHGWTGMAEEIIVPIIGDLVQWRLYSAEDKHNKTAIVMT